MKSLECSNQDTLKIYRYFSVSSFYSPTQLIAHSFNRVKENLSVSKQLLFFFGLIFLIVVTNKEGFAQNGDLTLYALDRTTDELITLNPSTGEPTTIGPIGFSDVNGLAYDSITATLFGVDNDTGLLIEINPVTGQGTDIGPIGLGGSPSDPGHLGNIVSDLTFGPNNTLFALTHGAFSITRLITIDTVTGTGTLISGVNGLNGLAFHLQTGKMYASNATSPGGGLFEIDPTDGGITYLSNAGIQVDKLSADPNADKLFAIVSFAFPGVTELWSIDLTSLIKTQIGRIDPNAASSIFGIETVVFQAIEGPPGDPTCSDWIDNDGDGDIDLDDSDCQVVSECNPPDLVFIDNSGAYGLFEGLIENVYIDDITTVVINIQSNELLDIPILGPRALLFWVSIDDIFINPGDVQVAPNEDDPLGASLADNGFIGPGAHASFLVTFCQPGTVTFELGLSEHAIILTLADAIFPIISGSLIPPGTLVAFASALDNIPLVSSAHVHVGNAIVAASDGRVRHAFRELARAGRDLVRLGFNRDQRRQLRQAYTNLGINITARTLISALIGAPIRVFETFGDVIVLLLQTEVGTAGSIHVELVAE